MDKIIGSALSGLLAQSNKAATHSANIANAGARPSQEQRPQPVDEVFLSQESQQSGATSNTALKEDTAQSRAENINIEEEIIGLKQAETAYKANLFTLKVAQELDDELLDSVNIDA